MSSPPSFSRGTPNKLGFELKVAGKNTLKRTEFGWRHAIADEPIDATVDGTKSFCVRVDSAGDAQMMIGFTPLEKFPSSQNAYFGYKNFTGCGFQLSDGNLWHPENECHNIIDYKISKKSEEVVVILTISNNGTKKEICFLCDGNESKSTDVSEHLNGDCLFPAVCLMFQNQQVTTISIDQIKARTAEIEKLTLEYPRLRFISNSLHLGSELQRVLLQQHEILMRVVTASMKFQIN